MQQLKPTITNGRPYAAEVLLKRARNLVHRALGQGMANLKGIQSRIKSITEEPISIYEVQAGLEALGDEVQFSSYDQTWRRRGDDE